MSHLNFESNVSELTRMDAPIQRGPLMRWQRKAMESGLKKLAIPSDGGSPSRRPKSATAKTPLSAIGPKTPTPSFNPKTPTGKTPGKAGKGSGKTPNKKTPKTPHQQQQQLVQDRFIPSRSTTDMEMGHYKIMTDNAENEPVSPSRVEYQQKMSEALASGQVPPDAKILSYRQKAPQASEGHLNNLRVLYSSSTASAGPKAPTTRQIPQQPERILDAPELLDDYYLNLLDWSVNNHLAVALGGAVYLWNAGNGTISQLMESENPDEYISSVNWIKEGNILGIGKSNGSAQLWDVGQSKLIRSMSGHAGRVGSLSWNSYILSTGSRSGSIHHHDVRVAQHHVATLANHSQEVCGLSWSPDGRYLASGGNDNLVNIWDPSLGDDVAPVHTFTHHQAAVKALAWCPWQPSLLATGGGTADRHIRFWNVSTGGCLNSVDTNSQVCSILWSNEYKELISGHGFSHFQLTIWKYPSMARITDLTGHTARVLNLSLSPDGSTVASTAADETLRLWKCFAVDKISKKKPSTKPVKETPSNSLLQRGIR